MEERSWRQESLRSCEAMRFFFYRHMKMPPDFGELSRAAGRQCRRTVSFAPQNCWPFKTGLLRESAYAQTRIARNWVPRLAARRRHSKLTLFAFSVFLVFAKSRWLSTSTNPRLAPWAIDFASPCHP